MFCLPRKSTRYQALAYQDRVIIEIPVIARESLPILPEHKIQNPYEEIIDDPSIIFFDPDEKPGFTYSAVPFVSQGLDFTYDEPLADNDSFAEIQNTPINNINVFNNKLVENRSNSPQYDDSLDGNSRPPTPPPITDTSFERERGYSSTGLRRDSLELDEDILSYPSDNFMPMESTRYQGVDVNQHHTLQQNSFHENSYIDDFGGINLYEDNLLSGVRLNYANKGYASDAESVKTYQDSGIYDDDLDDSPKSLASVARQLVFGDENFMNEEEKYTAFKTPMSSRQSSVESLIMDSYNNSIGGRRKEINEIYKAEGFRISDRPKRMIFRFMSDEHLECETSSPVKTDRPHNLTFYENDEDSYYSAKSTTKSFYPIKNIKQKPKRSSKETSKDVKDLISPGKNTIKTSNKYSYVQAKVQCHRTKSDRSPSPGRGLKSKSPGTSRPRSISPGTSLKNQKNKRAKSPGGSYTLETISSANKSKTKQENSSHDRSKVFNEKLTFREKAKSRTDSHGVEMYSNLPKEFQEIARRLARQDRELKRSETDLRGRSASRRSSRFTSRASSISPSRSYAKSRSKSETRHDGNIEMFTYDKESETPSKVLSRSSSVRSIPSTPALSRQHPLPELQATRAKSPGASPGRSPAHRLSHANTSKEQHSKRLSNIHNKKESTPSPVSKLYTFTTVNDSFGSSPIEGTPMFPMQTVH